MNTSFVPTSNGMFQNNDSSVTFSLLFTHGDTCALGNDQRMVLVVTTFAGIRIQNDTTG